MANNASSKKRILTSERNRLQNAAYKSQVRTAIKKVQGLVAAKAEADVVEAAYREAQSLVDRAVSKKIFKKNKGARDKSRLFAAIAKTAEATA